MSSFKCDLCPESFKDQFAFFEHLKQHYGPRPGTSGSATSPRSETENATGQDEEVADSGKSADVTTTTTSAGEPQTETETRTETLSIAEKETDKYVDGGSFREPDGPARSTDTADSMAQAGSLAAPDTSEAPSNSPKSNETNTTESSDSVASRIASIIERIALNVRSSASLSAYSSPAPSSNSNAARARAGAPLIHREEDIFIQTKKIQYMCPGCSRVFKREKKFAAHIAICCTKEDLISATEEIERNQSSKSHCALEQETESIGLFPNRDDFINASALNADDEDNIIGPDLIDNDDEAVANELLQKINKQVQFLSNVMCILCDSSFSSKSKLDLHLKKIHPEFHVARSLKKKGTLNSPPAPPDPNGQKKPEVLKCTECDRIFNHRNSLVYHMRSHTGERPHQCDSCGKSFFATSALKVHMRLHTGDKPFKCDHCGRYFRQWGDLKYHIISIHSSIRSYQCEFCGKDFARKYSLIVHRRIHTGERNYKCEYCSKSFRAASYLQNHRRIHTGEKPHSCMVCSKPFRVRSDMKRHMASHNREHPHPNLRNAQPSTQSIESSLEGAGADSPQVPNVITLNGFAPNQIVTIGSQQLSIGEGDTIQLMLDGRITVDQARQLAIDVRNHEGSIAGEIDETTPVITLASADGRPATLDGNIETVTSVQTGELSEVVMYSTGETTVATSRESNTVYVWPLFMNSV